jgi:hypothetical protein
MKRNKLFICLLIATILVIFTSAATCNLCGFSISPTTTVKEETEQSQEKDSASSQENKITSETESATEAAAEDVLGNAEEAPSSYSPEISTVILNGDDITQMIDNEAVSIHFGETVLEYIFLIVAEDSDSDELNFSVEASEGEAQNLHKTGSKTVEFSYIAPVELSGDGEIPYPATITISASDSDGNSDSFVIDIGLVPQITGFQLPKTASLSVVGRESGCININGDAGDAAYTNEIYIGDSTDDGNVSGFISFDITDLAGVEIVSAVLTMDLFEVVGDNRAFLGNLWIGNLDYGTGTLRVSDADIPANKIIQLPNSTTNINTGNNELANELQKNTDASDERFQLKIYWSHPSSNEDGGPDGLKYQKEDVSLTIQYKD